MPKIKYLEKKLRPQALATIQTANAIIADYQAQGFTLTLRQLYYQFVSKNLIPNSQKSYTNLGTVINDGRLVGLIDWYAIIDRTRGLRSVPHWADPSQIIHSAAESFRIDKWANQPYRPEVWIEKDAVAGVVEGICTRMDVPYFSCRGYTSQSEMWIGAQRIQAHLTQGQIPVILHFGDHDPSGKDMTRDITERLTLFMGGVKVKRLALNWNQIQQYHLPPNFAKVTDSRAKKYIQEFGHESWELDALEPQVIVDLVRTEVRKLRDTGKWEAKRLEEKSHRKFLQTASQRWPEVVTLLEA